MTSRARGYSWAREYPAHGGPAPAKGPVRAPSAGPTPRSQRWVRRRGAAPPCPQCAASIPRARLRRQALGVKVRRRKRGRSSTGQTGSPCHTAGGRKCTHRLHSRCCGKAYAGANKGTTHRPKKVPKCGVSALRKSGHFARRDEAGPSACDAPRAATAMLRRVPTAQRAAPRPRKLA